ncbi:unnamed protein product [Clonostachys chloroleuca]|uniref:Xylose isomerase-like TIM barrel domain-containing protein n=1 Tax=Clonostachys chloroleuca TaxID=1926264 RepID=A0AA35MB63_9HYPO|nr:unnamed protein product [Clonostachys chloroleuca]
MPFIPAVASPSLGHQTVHPIERRLKAAVSQGFKLIELVEDDITFYTREFIGETNNDNMIEGARRIKGICDTLGIKPCILQPFWFYEGLEDREEHAKRIKKLKLWMKLAKHLDIQLVQIPTNWLSQGTTGNMDVIVKDLVEMAEIGLAEQPPISFAYEGVAWGTHIDTWEGTLEVVKKVNRPNFGLCLDTYHIVARAWGDPTKPGCKGENGDQRLKESINRLVQELDVSKVFYVQLCDAELLDAPLVEGHPFHNPEQLPRMAWSRNARLFAWEEEHGGCLPLDALTEALFGTLKFDGLTTMETFSRFLFDQSPETPEKFAKRAWKSWERTMEKIGGYS